MTVSVVLAASWETTSAGSKTSSASINASLHQLKKGFDMKRLLGTIRDALVGGGLGRRER